MTQKLEVHVNWRHLVDAGCSVCFNRVMFDERHNIYAIYAHVEHPAKKLEAIEFRCTHHCGYEMTARVDGAPHVLPFLADVNVVFKLVRLNQ